MPRSLRSSLAAAVTALLLVAGCASSGDDDATKTNADPTVQPPPSTRSSTDVTAVSSLAVAETLTVPLTTAPLVGEVMVAVGGVVSGAAFVVAEAGADAAWFPPASNAVTV